ATAAGGVSVGMQALRRRCTPCGYRTSDRCFAQAGIVLHASTRSHLLASDRMRVAGAAAITPAHQVDVDVVIVVGVGAWRQYRGELIARRALHVAQEGLLLRQTMPAALDGDLAAVGQRKGGNVERIAERVLRNARARIAVHAAAGIGRDLANLDHWLA